MGDSTSQNVVDATHNDSTTEHKEIGGKDETLVKIDCIDLGIGELEKEISHLTQKLTELKLQNTCETPSQVIGIQHKSNDKNAPMRIENKIETRNGPREGSSEKRKKGRAVSAKFIQYSSKSQPKFKKKNDKMTKKSIASGTSPQIQMKSRSSGP